MIQVVIDSSAILAILFSEPGCEVYQQFIRRADVELLIGAPTLLELHMVLSGRTSRDAEIVVGTLLAGKRHRVIAFDEGMVRTAHTAFVAFGKGRRHPAGLNFGDCMAYAVARALDLPLLFKGDDFMRTDVRRAIG